MSPDSAPTLAYGVCDDDLTGLAGLGVVARLARFLGLPEQLAASVRLQRRRRGCSDVQMLLALIYSACAGAGHLHAVDAWGPMTSPAELAGCGPCPTAGGSAQTCSGCTRRPWRGLRECARLVSRRLGPLVAQACGQRWGSVPVFVDGTGIEVEGQLCENAGRGYNGEKQYWLHSVFVGAAWVSARLNAGGTDVRGDWREQLDQDVAPWLTGRQPVGLRGRQRGLLQRSGELLPAEGLGVFRERDRSAPEGPDSALGGRDGAAGGRVGASGRGGQGAGARGGVPAGPLAGGAGVRW